MQVPVKAFDHPSVRKSLFFEALMADDPAIGVREDDAVARDGPGRE
jgi:hypothetical protein